MTEKNGNRVAIAFFVSSSFLLYPERRGDLSNDSMLNLLNYPVDVAATEYYNCG